MARVPGVTRRLDIPHEPGEWMVIRRLPWTVIAESKEIAQTRALKIAALLGEIKVDEEARAAAKSQAADPLIPHDQATLLRHGVVEWSYDGPLNVEELDLRTAEWAAREIARFADPGEADLGKA